ncbi:hypothetical protein COV82_02400 [Candidatus Peregrinibacteria bacterium CG11_big_fil_rev_8_21_14_0_20_46_8]|nr:MAG: hypothetical protein COV82_02400 [Candidatus Peregrinibacteria bacterium CG11_big_fil_rev_8_21_14_0_20_46_8]
MNELIFVIGVGVLALVLGGRYIAEHLPVRHTAERADRTAPKSSDKAEITQLMGTFEEAMNTSDTTLMRKLIALENTELQRKFDELLRNKKIRYSIPLKLIPFISKQIDTNTYRFSLPQSAGGRFWKVNGIPARFTVQRRGGTWVITDSNVPERLNVKHILRAIATIFAAILLINGIVFFLIATQNSTAVTP